jgi:hypothetical protein
MAISLAAALVALFCVAASARRFVLAVTPTTLDLDLVRTGLEEADRDEGDDAGGPRVGAVERATRELGLRQALAADPRLAWERSLFEAFDEARGPVRDALVNEALLTLEERAERWQRVPRVCASIGTSAGLLFGSIALLQGLSIPTGDDTQAAIQAALASALAAVSFGIAATAFCVAVHVRSGRAARRARVAVDALVERLRCLSDRAP